MTVSTQDTAPARSLGVLALAGGACAAVAGLGGLATAAGMADGWYMALDKPSWNPPDGVFGPVWTALYAANAVAAWRVWRAAGPRPAGR